MKKFVQYFLALGALTLMTVVSCTKSNEFDTDQYGADVVKLQAYGPQPVVRGGVLRFVGSNLDKVSSITLPGVAAITPEVVTAGTHSEIRITVPKDGPEVGYPVLTLSDGSTITGKTQLTYSEPITIESFSPAEALPGATVTIKGDYLNLIHEVIFAENVIVGEAAFISHDRYAIEVRVPEDAQTGKIGLGTIDETAVEDEDLLSSLNIIETEEAFVVTTAQGKVAAATYKAGQTVTINGTNLNLVKTIYMDGATLASGQFTASATKLTFVLDDTVTDTEVVMAMASGVEVSAGSITTVVPTGLAAAPAPIKNGAVLTITGEDLDLVSGLSFPNSDWAEFSYADGKITATVTELAQEGDITLSLANSKNVFVSYTLVKPVVTGFSANPASAGSDVTIEGTDLDLVSSVYFPGAEAVDVAEASETAITVIVPTAAETGKIALNLKNGTSVEGIELAIDKPVAAYLVSVPTEVFKVGDLFLAEIENADHLVHVLFDDIEVYYVLNNGKLYATVPSGVKQGTILHLVSDNGTLDYPLNIDPGDFIVTPIWDKGFDCAGWNGNQDLAWGGFDWSSVKPGTILRFELEGTKAPGEWWCISLRHGDNWGALAGVPGQYDTPESPLDVVLTQEIINDLVANYGLVVTGDGFHLSRICLVEDLRYGDAIWEGLFECSGWNGNQDLAWGGFDWSSAKVGQTLFFHMTSTVAEGEWWCISLRHGDSWGNIAGLPGQYDSPESPMGVVLTQEVLSDLQANGGLVITGTGFNLTKISLK